MKNSKSQSKDNVRRSSVKKGINSVTHFRKQERQKSPFVRRKKNYSRKTRPGQIALQQIRRMQNSVHTIFPKASFTRLVREVCQQINSEQKQFRWTSDGLHVLQSAAEDYLVGLFQDSYLCSIHCKRITLMCQDLHLARRIRGLTDPGNRC